MQLLLFDIDGTLLLGAHGVHREALHEALKETYGALDRAAAAAVAAAGRTDSVIAREILARSALPDVFDEYAERFRAACVAAYERACPASLADCVAPGVRELLETLTARDDVIVSLLTGNYEPIARLKLARAGIGEHFAAGQGAFGSDAELREQLPAIARARAGVNGAPHPREQTLVIGDTPLDIACARADGLRVVAVASGPYGAQELSAADHVVADAWELRDVLSP
jgi:phosphoglycolate phosphatase-like HAD superfamily hydrolase